MRLVLHAVILAELFDRLFDDDVAREPLDVPLHGAVVREEAEIVRELVHLGVALRAGGQAHAAQHFTDIALLLGKREKFGEVAALGEELLPILAAVLFQHRRRKMQVRELFLEVHQPDLLDALVLFVVVAAPIEVALGVFVHDHALEHIRRRVGQAAVARDVLLLDHGDLRIQLAAQLRVVQVGDVEIVVHRLLLGGGDDGDVQAGDRVVEEVVDIKAHVVLRGARLGDGRAAGHDLGVGADQLFGVDAPLEIQKIGIAIEMVEVLEEGEVHLFFDVGVLFALREDGGEVDGELFVADGVFEDALVDGFEGRDALLLLLFAAADERHAAAHVVVGAATGQARRVPDRLKLRAVHQDDAHAGVRIDRLLVVRADVDALPALVRLFDVFCFFLKRVHGDASFFEILCAAAAFPIPIICKTGRSCGKI